MLITYLVLIFFFFLKGLRLGVWQTTNLSVGGSNLTNVNYANIGEQILTTLTNTMTKEEKKSIKIECRKFIQCDEKTNRKFLCCSQADLESIYHLEYLLSGKGTIPYKMINRLRFPKKSFFPLSNSVRD